MNRLSTLSSLGPKIWNSLPSDLKSANNLNSFKHKIKDKFFKDLQNQENSPYLCYIDIPKPTQFDTKTENLCFSFNDTSGEGPLWKQGRTDLLMLSLPF